MDSSALQLKVLVGAALQRYIKGSISIGASAAEVAIPSLLSLCAIQKLRMPCHLDGFQLTLIRFLGIVLELGKLRYKPV